MCGAGGARGQLFKCVESLYSRRSVTRYARGVPYKSQYIGLPSSLQINYPVYIDSTLSISSCLLTSMSQGWLMRHTSTAPLGV